MKKWFLSAMASVMAITGVSAVGTSLATTANADDASYTLTFDMPSEREDWAESSKMSKDYLLDGTQTINYQSTEVYAGSEAIVVTETAGTTSGQAILNTHAKGPITSWDANKKYTVSFMMKGAPFHFYFDHTGMTLLDDWVRPGDGWTYYEYTFTPSEVKATPGRYSFLFKVAENNGKTYLDDFFIEEYKAPTTYTVAAGSAIGELPALEEGKAWAIDGKAITADTVWEYTESKTATIIDAYTLTFEKPSAREDWAESSKLGANYLLNGAQTIAYQTEEVYAGSEAIVITETKGTTSGWAIINTHEKAPITEWNANTKYTISFRFKGASIKLGFDHAGEAVLVDKIEPEDDWTYYEYSFTPSEAKATPGRYSFLIKVLEGNVKVYIDDLFIEEAPTTSTVVEGNPIGELPELEEGKAWAIDGEIIAAETLYQYTENKTATVIDVYTLTFDMPSAREDWAESSKIGANYLLSGAQTIAYQTEEVYAGSEAIVITETAGTTSGWAIINTHSAGPITAWDANTKYTISFRFKGAPIQLAFDHAGAVVLDDKIEPEDGWTYYEYSFTPSEVKGGADVGRYSFLIKVAQANAKVYIDDLLVELYKAPTTVTLMAGSKIGELPAIPEKEGYINGRWTIGGEEITADTVWAYTENQVATVVYTPVEYTVTFKNGEETVGTATYTVESTEITAPVVPAKEHYTGAWETYTLDGGDKVVNAVYTAVEYTVTFKNGEEMVGTATYSVESTEITAPAVPAKEHYTGAWETYMLDGGDKVVNAVYTAVEYTVTFKNGEETVGTATYSVESTEITAPAVPAKEHYTGAWETYTLDGGDKVVNAVYTAVEYTVTFKADGEVVATETYTVENATVTAPTVPTKANYTGVWETYTLDGGNKVVNAVYTEVEDSSSTTEPDSSTNEPDSSTTEPDSSTSKPNSSTGAGNTSADGSPLAGCMGTIGGVSGVVAAIGFAVAVLNKKKED